MKNEEEQMAHNGLNGLTQTTTAIEWLVEKLYKKGFLKEVDGNEPINLMNKAKEMEKQQIETAYYDGKQNIPSMTEEEPKQLTAKEALLLMRNAPMTFVPNKRMYSEEETLNLWNWLNDGFIIRKSLPTKEELFGWFEQFKNK